MSKNIPPEIWAFDCEWVPDLQAGRLLYRLPPQLPDSEVLRVMWEHGGATTENPQPFLRVLLCRVVSTVTLIRRVTPEGVKLFLHSLPENPTDATQTESYILKRFLADGVSQRNPVLVGYNSRNSDMRILMQRAIVKGLQLPELQQRLHAKPWESRDIDLMEYVAGFGKNVTPSLNEIATLSGIPGKFDTTGDDVCGLWFSGKLRQIVQYNTFDTLTTYLLWLRVTYFAGNFTLDEYLEEQRRVILLLQGRIETNPEDAHLRTYLKAWRELHEATNQPYALFPNVEE